jgi:5-methylcytosine-specific restriction protein A
LKELPKLETESPKRQYILYDKEKVGQREVIRDAARKSNLCTNCSTPLKDKRKCYCNSKCKRAFWKKWDLAVVWWSDVRRRVLKRDNYLCQRCLRLGIQTRATEVHHLVEIQDGGDEFNEDNCESICNDCHKIVTAENRERRKQDEG